MATKQRQFREPSKRQKKSKPEEYPAAGDPSEPDRNGDERAQRAYWRKWKDSAIKAAKTHWTRCRQAWDEYLLEEPEVRGAADLTFRNPRKFPIYWSSVKTLQPAYYSRTPVPVVKQTFDNTDSVARVAAILCDRLAKFMLSRTPFDEAMESARDQYIMGDKAAGRVYFEPEIETTMDRIALQIGPDGMTLVDQTGQPAQGNVLQDDSGYYYERPGERLVAAQICFSALDYDDVLHTPYARNWSEITEIGYRVILSKTEARERFGDKIDHISFVQRKDARKDNKDAEDLDLPELYVEVWEIWDREKKQVLWYCDSYEDGLLKVEPDLYGIDGFFPQTEFVIGTKPAKSLYPTPWHTQVASTIAQLHNLWNRLFKLIAAVRRRAVADASIDALISAINDATELEVVAVQNFRDILEKNGIANLIQYLPVAELVSAIGELKSLITTFKEQFNEFTAIPDIVRGSSNAMEGVGTQQLKGQFASVRFSNDQRKIQMLALNGLELMIDLALAKLPVQIIEDITGAAFLPPTDAQFVPAAINLLKHDRKRIIRLEIETDSTSYLNDQVNAAQRNETAKTVMSGLQQVGQIAQAQPEFAGVALQTLLFALRGLAQGKSFEGEVAQAVTSLIQKISQPPPPPPPDYEAQKLALQQQELTLKGQAEMARFQLEQIRLGNEKLRLDMEQSLNISKYQLIDAPKLQLEYQKEKNATDLKIQQLQLQLSEATTTAQREQIKLQQKAVQDNFERFAESQRLAMERQFTMLSEREKMIEENRLRGEQMLEAMRLSFENKQPQVQAPQQPPIVNIIQQEKPREVVLERLPDGSLVGRTRDVQF